MGGVRMIAIISAMRSEIEALCDKMHCTQNICLSGCDIYIGKLAGQDVLCAISGEGKVNAAACTEAVILKYQPSAVINIGVGGGIAPFLQTGDIVIADKVVQHDYDVSALGFNPGQVCNFEDIYMICDQAICECLYSSAKEVMSDGIYYVYKGIIATGDSFISNSVRARDIAAQFDAYVVEMEGASVGQVCLLNRIPFCIVRTVSDNGGDSASLDFHTFLTIAIKNITNIIEYYLMNTDL